MDDTSLAQDRRTISGDELQRMPDPGRCELVRGRIVLASPTSPKHGRIEGNFYHHLRAFVEPRRLGEVLVGEVGVYTRRGPDTVRGADVLFLSTERRELWERRQSERETEAGFLDVAPDLVVEVLSPSESRAAVEEKVAEYLSAGVRLVWVADPATRTVRVHRPLGDRRTFGDPRTFGDRRTLEDPRTFGEGDILPGDEVLPGFEVEVRRLFEG